MDMLTSAIKGLAYFNAEKKIWGQAHILASWAIFSVIREGDPSVISIDFCEKDGKDYFYMTIDRSKLRTTAH